MATASLRLSGWIALALFGGKIPPRGWVGGNDAGLACSDLRDTLEAIHWTPHIGADAEKVRREDGRWWRYGLR